MRLKLLLSLLLLFLAPSLASAAGLLRVGLSGDSPPLHFKHEGNMSGVEVDFARAIGEVLRRRVEFVELDASALISRLQLGEIDVIMSGMRVTQQRSEQVRFTEPYLQLGQMAIMHKAKAGRFSQPWAVYREGVRVGVEPDSAGAVFAERELKDAEIVYFADPDAGFEGLRSNTIDLYVHEASTSWQLAKTLKNDDLISLYAPLTDEVLAWAVQSDNVLLAKELNRALELLKSTGSLQYILNRWIPVAVEAR